jgi:hypothetical protein
MRRRRKRECKLYSNTSNRERVDFGFSLEGSVQKKEKESTTEKTAKGKNLSQTNTLQACL